MKIAAAHALVCLLLPASALAASSETFETEGVRLRLVTQDAADAYGVLRGALVIELEDGWKTYWRDPGDAGIAPQIDVSAGLNVESAVFGFPVPGRYGDGADVWAGYAGSVSLPVSFQLKDPQAFTAIDADLFLGVCRDVCVPVQARLSVTPSGDSIATEPEVDQAFASLAPAADQNFGLLSVRDVGGHLVAVASLPKGSETADLFVAAPHGWVLRAPEMGRDGARTEFIIPVAGRPAGASTGTALPYTLVADGKAVEGISYLP